MKKLILLLFPLFLMIWHPSASGQSKNFRALFRTGIIEIPATFQLDEEAAAEGRYYGLIQFTEIPGAQEKEAIRAAGIVLEEYLPHFAFFGSIPQNLKQESLVQLGIRAFYLPNVYQKLAPELINELESRGNGFFDGNFEGEVEVFSGFSRMDFEAMLGYYDATGSYQPEVNAWQVSVPMRNLTSFLREPVIKAVNPLMGEIQLERTYRNTVSRANYLNTGVQGLMYNGSGITCAVREGRYDTDGIDWKGRAINAHSSTAISGHATGVATNMGGAGNYDPKYMSTAWGANIMAINGSYTTHYVNSGMRMVNHSYGWGVGGGYNTTSRSHDNNVRLYPGMIHVYSAGNVGSATSNYGPYSGISGWANLTGAPKQAKNIVATGNTNRYDALIYGSVGPTYDGRVKPDICIEGQEGTSYSAPKMCGVMAQLYEVHKDFNSGQEPESALIKSIIMNTADDIHNPGPDFKSGYGRINARRAYEVLSAGQHLYATVANNGTNTHSITVPAGTAELKVMLYWTDYEAATNAAKALVNDLDLTLTTPGSQVYQPWVLNIYPHPDSLNAPPTRKQDTLNNVEQITLSAPATGTYTLTVNGSEVPQGPQGYYINWEFVPDTLLITSPIGREHFVPGETEIIKWDATGSVSGPYTLEYSTDIGNSWTTIATNVSGNSRDWTVPNLVSGQVKVRVSNGSRNSVSPEFFNISPVPANLQVFRSCGDSITLIWDSLSGATGYRVTMLGPKYMDSIGTSTDPWFIVRNVDTTQTNWFSVQAYGNDGALSRRHLAIPWVPRDSNCSPAIDAEVIAITPYANGYYPDCYAGSKQPLGIVIRNSGVNALSNMPVGYQVDNGPVYTANVSTTLSSPASVGFTFPDSVQFGGAGTYTLKAWCAAPGDANAANDTLRVTVIVYAGQSATIPYTQNFDNFTSCSTAWGCEGISCNLTAGWYNQPNTPAAYPDSIDFRTHSGGTGTGGTGPSGDHTSGSGKYLYLETSGNGGSGCRNKQANLYSPCFDLTGTNTPTLTWWYHMYGSSIGTLSLDILGENGWETDAVPIISGAQGNQWNQATADLSRWAGQKIVVRFRATTGNGYTGDLAIDDINLETLPLAAFSGPSASCIGNTVNFTGSSGYANSVWWTVTPVTGRSFTGGTNAGSVSPQVQFTQSGTYTITLIAYGTNGNDTTSQTLVVANPMPDLGPDQDFCQGDSLVLSTAGSWQGFSWSNGSTQDSIIVNTAGNYWVQVTDSIGCLGTDSIQVNTWATPSPQLGPDLSLCPGDSVTLSPVATYPNYYWQDSSSANSLVVYQPGWYWVRVTDANGCTGTDSVQVSQYPVSAPVINQSNDTLVTSGGGTYQWYLNGSVIPGATQSWYLPSVNGSYTVVVVDPNGCEEESGPFTFLVGIAGLSQGMDLQVFPVPATSSVTIRMNNGGTGTYDFSLTDLRGKVLKTVRHTYAGGSVEWQFDLSGIANGIYALKVEDGKEWVKVLKVIKE